MLVYNWYVAVTAAVRLRLFSFSIPVDSTAKPTAALLPCPLLACQVLRRARKCFVEVEAMVSAGSGDFSGRGGGSAGGAAAVLARHTKVDLAPAPRGSGLMVQLYDKSVAIIATRLGVVVTRLRVVVTRLRVVVTRFGFLIII